MRVLFALCLLPVLLTAHVGSPDIFLEGDAGPYRIFVTVRPPEVIPGVAEVEIRTSASGITKVLVTPTPMTGPGAKYAPTPDLAKRSDQDTQFFTASVWLMSSGSWKVRVDVEGNQGRGTLAVPVPAVAQRTATMQRGLGVILFILMLLLAAGVVAVVGASVREAPLEAGETPSPRHQRSARIAMTGAAALVAGALVLGNAWWTAEARAYDRNKYKPIGMTVAQKSGLLNIKLENNWGRRTSLEDLVPDHGHMMHLFVIRQPEMDRVWHLHPKMTGIGEFEQRLPDLAPGDYKLFGEVVHRNGFGETAVADWRVAAETAGAPLDGDDSTGAAPPVSQPNLTTSVALSDGYRMHAEQGPKVKAKQAMAFRFRVEDASGAPAKDLQLYMGMQGHAAFAAPDGSVFAHVHPNGSVPMAALAVANGGAAEDHSAHASHALPATISFPYAVPKPGRYRVFVQVKRSGKVETGAFDIEAE